MANPTPNIPHLYAVAKSVYDGDTAPDFVALFISLIPVNSASDIPFESIPDFQLDPSSDYVVYRVSELSTVLSFTTSDDGGE